MSPKWRNPLIKKMQEKQDADWREVIALGKQIDYLYLQEEVCYDKIKLYKQRQDPFKVLWWEDLLDQCENVRIKTREARDILSEIHSEESHRLIELMNRDIKGDIAVVDALQNILIKKLAP